MGTRNELLTQAGAVDVTLECGASSLATKQYYAVKRDATTGLVVVADANAKCLGILQNTPAVGELAQVRVQGITLVELVDSGTITFGKFLTPVSDGTLEICDAADEEFIAVLLSHGAATGDRAEAIIARGEVTATDA